MLHRTPPLMRGTASAFPATCPSLLLTQACSASGQGAPQHHTATGAHSRSKRQGRTSTQSPLSKILRSMSGQASLATYASVVASTSALPTASRSCFRTPYMQGGTRSAVEVHYYHRVKV